MKRSMLGFTLCVCLFSGSVAAQEVAAPPPVIDLEAAALAPVQAVAVSELELDEARGGFMTALGLVFDFEAVIRSFDEDGLKLETFVDWTPNGPVLRQEGVGQSQGASFAHQVSDGDLRNLILNTDSNRNLRQETDVTLTLPGFTGFQQDVNLMRIGQTISNEIGATLRSGGQ